MIQSGYFNPQQLAQEITSFNQKFVKGLDNLKKIQNIPAGVTEKEIVFQKDKVTLYHYKPHIKQKQKNNRPLLICYALVNRPYMTDIQENRSTVRGLMEAGQDVYLIDWGYPDRTDKYLTMDDYINGYLDLCVKELCKRHNLDAIDLLGICQGGAFSLCYAAMHPQNIHKLITMVTPVDFHTPDNTLTHWIKNVDVDLLVDTMGNISGDDMNWTFLSMKPFELMGQKYLNMVEIMQDEATLQNFMQMEQWIFDSPDQAGETYRQFIKDFYQKNLLIKGEVKIGAHQVDLKNITMPVLNIYAKDDHLVPPSASMALKKYVGTKDYTELSFNGGHIGIYVSGRAQKEVPPAIGKWLNAA
ncbi:MAG: class III poly(R)-hydroxyalkanoic acid synthase subunit PhaC [Alphaproteobacteria bacterium]|nr:class III poly(R)-hydroxyalkanoic acid synthase subunit PhaC [Alphaproteobacteria bacterium]NCQ88795.1 class III poly(R)-hydroxyalkanoic acid synthase subunit PhaC [Alphaproteobacteria bacterium]NCT07282.1 class III poly(R)-hydroxyalkanoic acid synthase subunit PhaC [Alphaproteobacteria bacterium]